MKWRRAQVSGKVYIQQQKQKDKRHLSCLFVSQNLSPIAPVEHGKMLEVANQIYRSTRDEMALPYISPFLSLLVAFLVFLLGGHFWLMSCLGALSLICIGVYNNLMDTAHMDEYRIRLYRYLDLQYHNNSNNSNNRRSPRLAERKIEERPHYAE